MSIGIERENIVNRAIRAYNQWNSKMGNPETQPSNTSRMDDNNIITLENVNGILAKYRYIEETNRLQRINLK